MDLWRRNGIGTNGILYVGHGTIRQDVMGREDRAPAEGEMAAMQALVRKGMEEGAFGLSTGLFYVPGSYATTEEVIELARVAAEFDGAIYDTHDRDLGAVYEGIGYDASVAEGIRITEESGLRGIFSHYNLQGAHNYGRGDVGAKLINEARARGVDIWAAHHPYTATQSNLRSYTIPDWAAAVVRMR
jgi:N-acyl-D-amino-acid deacylase